MMTSRHSGSDPELNTAARAYEALHPEIRRWIREQGWTSLRPVQVEAITAILDTSSDVLISAGTAAGKTEAAFLPILTRAAEKAQGGLAVLYVAPLKALINDQQLRLEQLADRLGFPVVRWHGDAPPGPKNRVITAPRGVVLITPESIEAMFVRRANAAEKLFDGLRFIVIDEVHAFLGGIRGKHLASLLSRIDSLATNPARRIGLSATIGDLGMAAEWLRPGRGTDVRLLKPSSGSLEVQLQVRGYVDPSSAQLRTKQGSNDKRVASEPALMAVAEHIFRSLRGSNNLAFGGSRIRVEELADALRERSEFEGVPNEFFPHHGNLSRELREELETRLKQGNLPTTAVCTTTLELGIDIGSVASVAQVGAPRSISGLRQRLGRSGRRVGIPAALRIYVIENELEADPQLLDEIRSETVRAVAAVRLLIARFFEPPAAPSGMATVLLHQTLSMITQRGGAHAAQLFNGLCEFGPFRSVPARIYLMLLRAMGSSEARLIEQASDGLLMLGEVGERLVASRDFFALFESGEEWRLVTGGRSLGSLPLTTAVAVDNLITFAGRRWVVVGVDEKSHLIEVRPHKGGRVPKFEGGAAEPVHDRLAQEMLSVYQQGQVPTWVDSTAAEFLNQGFAAFRRHAMDKARVLQRDRSIILLTWRGDAINGLLAVVLRSMGHRCEPHDLGVTADDVDWPSMREVLNRLATAGIPDLRSVADQVGGLASAKFDNLLSDAVLREFWIMANEEAAILLPEVASALISAPAPAIGMGAT